MGSAGGKLFFSSGTFHCHSGPLFFKLGVFVRIYENSRSYLFIDTTIETEGWRWSPIRCSF